MWVFTSRCFKTWFFDKGLESGSTKLSNFREKRNFILKILIFCRKTRKSCKINEKIAIFIEIWQFCRTILWNCSKILSNFLKIQLKHKVVLQNCQISLKIAIFPLILQLFLVFCLKFDSFVEPLSSSLSKKHVLKHQKVKAYKSYWFSLYLVTFCRTKLEKLRFLTDLKTRGWKLSQENLTNLKNYPFKQPLGVPFDHRSRKPRKNQEIFPWSVLRCLVRNFFGFLAPKLAVFCLETVMEVSFWNDS